MSEKTKIELLTDYFKRDSRLNEEAGLKEYNVLPPEKQAQALFDNKEGVYLKETVDQIVKSQKEYDLLNEDEKKAKDAEKVKNLIKFAPTIKAFEESALRASKKALEEKNVKEAAKFDKTEAFKNAAKTFACGVKARANEVKSRIINKIKGNEGR